MPVKSFELKLPIMQQTGVEAGSLSRQGSFTVPQLSRGNSFVSQTFSHHGNTALGLQTEGTIEESIQILSVRSPHEENSGYLRDSTRLSVRNKSSLEHTARVRRLGSSATGFSRSYSGVCWSGKTLHTKQEITDRCDILM